jgi:hypothetical protein
MATFFTSLMVALVFCVLLYLFGRAKKQEGLSEADKAIAENAAALERKRNEIAAEPPLDRASILDGLSEPKRLF